MSHVHFPIKLNRFPYPEIRPCQFMNRWKTRQYHFHVHNHLFFCELKCDRLCRAILVLRTTYGKVKLTYYLLHGAGLLEKLIGSQLVKKFPAFYGTRNFITAFTSLLQRINLNYTLHEIFQCLSNGEQLPSVP